MSSRRRFLGFGRLPTSAHVLALVAALALNACGGGSGGDNQTAPPSVATIVVSPANLTLEALDATAQLEATARDGSGDPLAAQFSWTSANTAIATVSAGGLVTASDNGMTTVTVTSGGVSAVVAVTVEQRPTSITLSHEQSELTASGDTLQVQADVVDGNGHSMSAELTWESSGISGFRGICQELS